jgi:hypothetical protein
MRAKRSVCLLFAATAFAATSVSCSTPDYGTGSEKTNNGSNKAVAKGENAAGGQKPKAAPEFFSAGKSLDLHVIMDKSGSLWVDPKNPTLMSSGSDPNCKRLDALLDLVDGLRTKLNKGEFVRLTVVTFGNGSAVVGSIPDLLKETREAINNKLRPGVCEFPGQLETTNYAKGITASLAKLRELRMLKKLDVETNLFFSDGAAKDRPDELEIAINQLNSEFPKRVFGVLLGSTSDNCKLTKDGRALSTIECLVKVAGDATDKVIQSNDAAGLSAAMTSLLEK